MAQGKVAQGKRAPKKGALQQVSTGIRRTTKPADVDPSLDGTMVTVMRGDLALAAQEIRAAFDDVLAAELSSDGAQHDVLVLSALRRLRNAQSSVECEIGGAS